MARIATLFALMALSTQAVASDYSGEPVRPEVTLAGMTFELRTLPPGTQPVRKPPPPTSQCSARAPMSHSPVPSSHPRNL